MSETDEPPPSRAGHPSSRWLRVYGPIALRDTDKTPFTIILEALIDRVPGSYAAAIVDSDGETVDYAGRGEPFDLRVAAAHLQLVMHDLARFGAFGDPRWIVVRGTKKGVAATALPDGYALCVLLRPRAAFTISTRALKAAMRELALEAGWDEDFAQAPLPATIATETTSTTTSSTRARAPKRAWFPIQVATDKRGRPTSITRVARISDSDRQGESNKDDPPAIAVEILGAVMGLSVRERGYRVRTSEGGELMLVREPGPRWYADEPV